MQLLFWLFKMNFRLHWPQVEAFSLRTKLSSSKNASPPVPDGYFKSVINQCLLQKCWCHLDHLELRLKTTPWSHLNEAMTQCLAHELPHRAKPNLLCQPQSRALLDSQVWLEKHCTASVKIFHDLMMYDVSLFYRAVGFPTIISLAENQKTQTLPTLAAPTHYWGPQLL